MSNKNQKEPTKPLKNSVSSGNLDPKKDRLQQKNDARKFSFMSKLRSTFFEVKKKISDTLTEEVAPPAKVQKEKKASVKEQQAEKKVVRAKAPKEEGSTVTKSADKTKTKKTQEPAVKKDKPVAKKRGRPRKVDVLEKQAIVAEKKADFVEKKENATGEEGKIAGAATDKAKDKKPLKEKKIAKKEASEKASGSASKKKKITPN